MANPPKIVAILGNDTSFPLGEYEMSSSNSVKLAVLGSTKVITTQGTVIFTLVTSAVINGLKDRLQSATALLIKRIGTMYGNSDFQMPQTPYLNIDTQVGTLDFHNLPLGYQALRITTAKPSSVTILGYPGPTACDDSVVERWFYNRYKHLAPTQCVEMIWIDSTSVRIIATVRYLQELRLFVISTQVDNFRAMPISLDNVTIQSMTVTPRTNFFAETDTSRWFDRTGGMFDKLTKNEKTPYVYKSAMPEKHVGEEHVTSNGKAYEQHYTSDYFEELALLNNEYRNVTVTPHVTMEGTKIQVYENEYIKKYSLLLEKYGIRSRPQEYVGEESVTSNAQILAPMLIGAASGIGQEGSKMLDRKHQEKLQSKEHAQQQLLQSNQFGHNTAMQSN